ncbi:glucose-6-phosphate dehydrogenase [Thiomicrorhabdus arctica]|jgi:glucose-6-phosphate 1-dehydrogenase|uniref:glucose-6-phosphate dehydrogenase n=1 Tax=Thiomicrorhabdus arctica TaxID=131540 RepID=UPI00037DC552|nr:glucose-6-phosphate dehydrogenase [Thiomicrorhabdus arctica]
MTKRKASKQPLEAETHETGNESIVLAKAADPSNIVIFGATGDLTKRKLIPSLIRMLDCGLVHKDSRIIGLVNKRSKEEWIQILFDGLVEIDHAIIKSPKKWKAFTEKLILVPGDLNRDKSYSLLAEAILPLGNCKQKNAMFYCAIPPAWYGKVAQGLGKAGLVSEAEGYRRIVIEKPFGMNLETSLALNAELQAVFNENQIYRIDHYLGKESVQNLLVYRFANGIMEPLWNRNYIDNIQINVSETLGIEYRAQYYEKAGALRDMIQSHLMQVMTLVAMEPPVEFTEDAVRDEKIKVLRAVRRFKPEDIDSLTVAAQYAKGVIRGEIKPAYVAEEGVSPDSVTETFAAVRFQIDNWRWQGVPFILTSGKRLPCRMSEVIIRFKKPPFNLFNEHASLPTSNALIFRLQPDSGIVLRINAKKPGQTTDNEVMEMHAPYANTDAVADAYEVLMHDVLTGDGTLFSRADEVNESWAIIEPILNAWKNRVSIDRYPAGSCEITAMDKLTKDCLCGWYQPGQDQSNEE